MKPVPPAVEVWSLNHWTTITSPMYLFLYISLYIYIRNHALY